MRQIVSLAALLALTAAAAQAQFTPGNIAVLRINGTTTSAASGSIVEINSATGAPVGVVVDFATPAANNTSPGLTFSGTSSLGSYLHLSADKSFLSTIGYSAVTGTPSVTATPAATANRVIGNVSALGTASYKRFTDLTFTEGDGRAAVGANDGAYYVSGNRFFPVGGGGFVESVNYATFDAQSQGTSVSVTGQGAVGDINSRDTNVFGNRLFASVGSGVRVIGAGGPPPTFTSTVTPLSGVTGSDIFGFVFFDRNAGRSFDGSGLDSLYVTNGQEVVKYALNGDNTTWSAVGAYDSPAAGILFGLTGRVVGSDVELFFTDLNVGGNGSRLVKMTDAGVFDQAFTATENFVVNSGPGTIFRGVDFTPIPEPSSLSLACVALFGAALRYRRPCDVAHK